MSCKPKQQWADLPIHRLQVMWSHAPRGILTTDAAYGYAGFIAENASQKRRRFPRGKDQIFSSEKIRIWGDKLGSNVYKSVDVYVL